jgi:hypothetical protein
VDRDDVWVAQAGGDPRLAAKPLLEFVVVAEQLWQELQRNEAIAIDVSGLVDIAHPAAADLPLEAVPTEPLPLHLAPRPAVAKAVRSRGLAIETPGACHGKRSTIRRSSEAHHQRRRGHGH